jgi:hypothetical protein
MGDGTGQDAWSEGVGQIVEAEVVLRGETGQGVGRLTVPRGAEVEPVILGYGLSLVSDLEPVGLHRLGANIRWQNKPQDV